MSSIDITEKDLQLSNGDIPKKPTLTGSEVLHLGFINQLAYVKFMAEKLISQGEIVQVVSSQHANPDFYCQLRDTQGFRSSEAPFLNACTIASVLNCLLYMDSEIPLFWAGVKTPDKKPEQLEKLYKKIQEVLGIDYANQALSLSDVLAVMSNRIPTFSYQRANSPLELLWTLLHEGCAVVTGPGSHAVSLVELGQKPPYYPYKIEALQKEPSIELADEGGFTDLFGPRTLISITPQAMQEVFLLFPKVTVDPLKKFRTWMESAKFPTQLPFHLPSPPSPIIIK